MIIKYFDNFNGVWKDISGSVGSTLVITDNGFEVKQLNKKYIAQLTQTLTDDPTVDVQIYSLLGNITWTRDSAGEYNGYSFGGFKDTYLTGSGVIDSSPPTFYNVVKVDDDNVLLRTFDDALAPSDDILKQTTIEITTYN